MKPFVLLACLLAGCSVNVTTTYNSHNDASHDTTEQADPRVIEKEKIVEGPTKVIHDTKVIKSPPKVITKTVQGKPPCGRFALPELRSIPPLLNIPDNVNDAATLNALFVEHVNDLRDYIKILLGDVNSAYQQYLLTCNPS